MNAEQLTLLDTLRAPPATTVVRSCACGKSYDRAGWLALEYVGIQVADPDERYELRNCTCGSTIALELECPPATPSDPRPNVRIRPKAAPSSAEKGVASDG